MFSSNFMPLEQLASSLHLPAPGFLTDSRMMASIGNIVTWQWTGYNMIITYAALQAIPAELYEAALVDGATGWKVARYIKIPLIAPALVLTCVFSIIGSL